MTSPKMAIFTIVSVSVQFSLAVIGRGGPVAFFSHPPLVALAIGTAAFMIAALFTSASVSPGEREDRGNRWVLAAFGVLGLLACYLPAYADRKDIWPLDGNTLRWAGVAIFVAGGVLRMWPVFVLGRRFSGLVAIQPGHRLETTGIYGVIRHPSYLGMLINALGWALVFNSGVGVVLVALLVAPLLARIHAEEAMLRAQFDGEYDAYRARTSRLIPGIY
jgi:protein-S-isoprenylcysteine O-methyltransferase Ste14